MSEPDVRLLMLKLHHLAKAGLFGEFLGCRSRLTDDSFLRYDATSLGNWIPTFRGNVVSRFSRVEIYKKNWIFRL
jgi:hypothetical protein